MAMDHPELQGDSGLEPTVGEQLRLGEFLNALERASEQELRQLCRAMAQQVLITYPSAMRYLAREAARNLAGVPWREESSERLMKALGGPG